MSLQLTGGEIDTLIKLVEKGPLSPGGIPSKVGLNGLLSIGFATQVVIDGDHCQYVANMDGLDWYLKRYNAENIKDAKTNRIIATPLP